MVTVFNARFYAECGYATVSRLSICLRRSGMFSHWFGYFENNFTESWPNSLRLLLGLTPTCTTWCNGNTPKIKVE